MTDTLPAVTPSALKCLIREAVKTGRGADAAKAR
jgi:hypothetical protein